MVGVTEGLERTNKKFMWVAIVWLDMIHISSLGIDVCTQTLCTPRLISELRLTNSQPSLTFIETLDNRVSIYLVSTPLLARMFNAIP